MTVLNEWQKITRVLPGQPAGDGIDGNVTITTSTQNVTKRSCSGTIDTPTLNLGALGFANGDLVKIIQMSGTGQGQYEINMVLSGGGTTALTMKKNLKYTYTDSGSSQAQVIKIPRYNIATISASNVLSAPDWDGDIGGELIFAARVKAVIAGTINGNGLTQTGNDILNSRPQNGGGFKGGDTTYNADGSKQGDSSTGPGSVSSSANGGGGGAAGGNGGGNGSAGGGGGNGTSGSNGANNGATGGTGGSTTGAADLTTMTMGNGGGGGGWVDNNRAGMGGNGGAMCTIFADFIEITGGINVNGGNGQTEWINRAGAGSGGSCLLVCNRITGLNLVSAIGGTGSANGGGNGGDGRVAVHYGSSVSGESNPAANKQRDASLIPYNGNIVAIL